MATTSTIVTVASSPVYIDATNVAAPATVTAIPGASGTMAIAYSTTPGAAALGASATWVAWPSGTVSVTTGMTLGSPVQGIRATAATSTGTVEITR
jgi:hypothetical protein